MEPELVVAASERIQRTIMEQEEFKEAESIGLYLALPYEIQTNQLIETSWYGNKRVCVPAFNEENARYELTWVGREDETRYGRWNIQEPTSTKRAGVTELDLIIVPALAYDHQGARLGHGGGHYDRILGSWLGYKIGVAFDFQIFDSIPTGKHDIPVDRVVTEKTIYPDQKNYENKKT